MNNQSEKLDFLKSLKNGKHCVMPESLMNKSSRLTYEKFSKNPMKEYRPSGLEEFSRKTIQRELQSSRKNSDNEIFPQFLMAVGIVYSISSLNPALLAILLPKLGGCMFGMGILGTVIKLKGR